MSYCTVSTSVNPDKVYLETAEGDLKRGYYSHVKSFRNKWHINDTSFSKHTWEIKAKHQQNLSLEIHLSYSNITKNCLLCLLKKIEIVNYPHPEELLSKRSELVSKCWHSNKYLLYNNKANDLLLPHPSRLYAVLCKYNFDVKRIFLRWKTIYLMIVEHETFSCKT